MLRNAFCSEARNGVKCRQESSGEYKVSCNGTPLRYEPYYEHLCNGTPLPYEPYYEHPGVNISF